MFQVSKVIAGTWSRRRSASLPSLVHITSDEASTLNSRGRDLVGRTYVVKESIVAGKGTIAVGDSTWPAAGPDIPAGTTVTVRRLDGIYCQV